MKMKPYVHPAAVYPYREWSLDEETYDEENNQRSESVFALGNGYIGMRGNFEEGYHGHSGSSVIGNYLNGFLIPSLLCIQRELMGILPATKLC